MEATFNGMIFGMNTTIFHCFFTTLDRTSEQELQGRLKIECTMYAQ